MAAKKSAQYPHRWSDGTYHSITQAQHDANVAKAEAAKRVLPPPPGTYDPNLDAQERASGRGLGDLIEDVGRGRERASTDYGIGTQQLDTDYGINQQRIEQGYQRNLSDLLKARTQGEQDYGSNIQGLQRGFQRLGVAQGEGQRKAGALMGSGAALQAARKRTENEAIERAPIDTAYNRFMEQSRQTEGRLGEDKTASLGDLLRGYQTQTGQLGVGYGRQNEDLTTQQSRAEREALAFGQDIAAARQAQYGGPLVTVSTPNVKKPKKPAGSVYINGKKVSQAQWERGDLLRAMTGGR